MTAGLKKTRVAEEGCSGSQSQPTQSVQVLLLVEASQRQEARRHEKGRGDSPRPFFTTWIAETNGASGFSRKHFLRGSLHPDRFVHSRPINHEFPPGKCTEMGTPHGSFSWVIAAATAAHAPVPHACVNPQPRSWTVSDIVFSPTWENPTLTPSGNTCSCSALNATSFIHS